MGGIPEYVADGRTGFLFPAGDHRHLAERVRDLLDDPQACHLAHAPGGLRVVAQVANARGEVAVIAGREEEAGAAVGDVHPDAAHPRGHQWEHVPISTTAPWPSRAAAIC